MTKSNVGKDLMTVGGAAMKLGCLLTIMVVLTPIVGLLGLLLFSVLSG